MKTDYLIFVQKAFTECVTKIESKSFVGGLSGSAVRSAIEDYGRILGKMKGTRK